MSRRTLPPPILAFRQYRPGHLSSSHRCWVSIDSFTRYHQPLSWATKRSCPSRRPPALQPRTRAEKLEHRPHSQTGPSRVLRPTRQPPVDSCVLLRAPLLRPPEEGGGDEERRRHRPSKGRRGRTKGVSAAAAAGACARPGVAVSALHLRVMLAKGTRR